MLFHSFISILIRSLHIRNFSSKIHDSQVWPFCDTIWNSIMISCRCEVIFPFVCLQSHSKKYDYMRTISMCSNISNKFCWSYSGTSTMNSQVTGDTFINLTQSTVNFCRHYLSICESCAILAKIESLRSHTQTLLQDLFLAQYNSKPNPNVTVDVSANDSYLYSNRFFWSNGFSLSLTFMQLNFVSKNNAYLVDTLLPVAISKYQKVSGGKCEILAALLNQLRGPPKPKPRSIYKTDVL